MDFGITTPEFDKNKTDAHYSRELLVEMQAPRLIEAHIRFRLSTVYASIGGGKYVSYL